MNAHCAEQSDEIDEYLNSVEHLPPTPTLLVQLIGLFRKPDRDVDEVVTLLRNDPSLSAEVLRCCNSSYYGGEEPILDIGDAVFRIGFHEVYRLTMCLFGLNAIGRAGKSSAVPVNQLWRHCAITAIASGITAYILRDSETTAFTAGLFHDVGKMVLASDTRYPSLLKLHGLFGGTLHQAEKSLFGFDHAMVGARLLQRWGVPEQIIIPVLTHHDTEWPAANENLSAIVSLGNELAHHIETNDPSLLPDKTPALTSLGFGADELPALEDRIRKEMKRSLSVFAPS